MANRQQNRGGGGGGDNVRQNEYFVPRDGIDREVITADICRYLGNDALVRPGNYHNVSRGAPAQLARDPTRLTPRGRKHRTVPSKVITSRPTGT